MLDDAGKLSSASRAVAIIRCVSLIASILVGSPPYHPVHANDRTVRPERVLSVVTADWNGDGLFDRARNRWTRKLTVVYRDQSFVVAGYTYTERDTLAAGASSSCDINLLTGEGVKNKKSFRTSARAVALADWSEVAIPQECR